MENPFHRWIGSHSLGTALVSHHEHGEFWPIHKAFRKDARCEKAYTILTLYEARELGLWRTPHRGHRSAG